MGSYFNTNVFQNVLDKLNAIIFLNSYDYLFQKMVNKKFSFFFHKNREDMMLEILQKIFVDKAYEIRVPDDEIMKNLMDLRAFTGWIKVALGNSEEMRKEMIYKYRNNPFLLEAHKIFMNSLNILTNDYNLDNYTTCIIYFDELWDELTLAENK